MIPSVTNVLGTYERATEAMKSDGLAWYKEAHDFCLSLDYDVERAAGVVAALSPNNRWDNNMRMAERLYSQGHGERCGLGANVTKAMKIYNGAAPLDVLGGNKVRAFYLSIAHPDDMSVVPVIDRHAFDIAVGKITDTKSRGILKSDKVYNSFADVYVEAASAAGIGPKQMQAATWVAWREIHGIA